MKRPADLLRRVVLGRPTALIVPVLDLPLEVPTAPGLPPHITVLYPFVRTGQATRFLHRRLKREFAQEPAFDFSITQVGRFPGVLWLAPEPARPFVALTERCERTWPAFRPYGGAYTDTVPHLTVIDHAAEPAGLAERLTAMLPVAARASELWLMAPGRRGWRRLASVPLGST